MKISYNKTSIIFCVIGAIAFLLVLLELTHLGKYGNNYMELLSSLIMSDAGETSKPVMKSLGFMDLNQARILTALYFISVVSCMSAMVCGFIARRRRESWIGHSAPVALSFVVLALAFNLRWIVEW